MFFRQISVEPRRWVHVSLFQRQSHKLPPLVPPTPPAEGDCCGDGCEHCVLILYEQDLQAYMQALKERQRQGYPLSDDERQRLQSHELEKKQDPFLALEEALNKKQTDK